MSYRELFVSICTGPGDRDVSSPEGVRSPLPPRRGGLRSGRNTPSSGEEGRTHLENAPGSEEHMHKRGERGDLSGTSLRRHPRRLSFDKELVPSKALEADDLGNHDGAPKISSRKKRKAIVSPRKEPVSKAWRGEQDEEIAVDISRSTRLTRRGNMVTEPSTPPAGENLSKKTLGKEAVDATGDKVKHGDKSEEPLNVGNAMVDSQSGNSGKRPRGRPRKSKAPVTEQAITAESTPDRRKQKESKSTPAEILSKSRKRPAAGRLKKKKSGISRSKPSDRGDDSLVSRGVEKMETTVPSSPLEAVEQCLLIEGAESVLKSQLSCSVEDKVGQAVPGVTPPNVEKSSKRPAGRPRKVPLVPVEGKTTGDAGRTSRKSPVSVPVDETEKESTTIGTPESTGQALKRSRGRPRKLQNLSTQKGGVSDPPMKTLDNTVTENGSKMDAQTENILTNQSSALPENMSGTNDTPENYMQIIMSVSEAVQADSLRALDGDPCDLFLEDPEQVYLAEDILKSKPTVVTNESEKGSACITPDATEKALKRSVGRPRKVQTGEMELKYGSEGADDNPKMEVAAHVQILSSTQDNTPCDKQARSIRSIKLELAVRDTEEPHEPFPSTISPVNMSNIESDAKDDEKIKKAVVKRPVGSPRKAGRKKLTVRPKKIVPESNHDVSTSAMETRKTTGRKRGRPSKNSVERKPKAAVGRRRPTDGQSKAAETRSPTKEGRYLTRVVLDEVEFRVGHDVYVRKSGSTCSESDTEMEECQICGKMDEETMIECDKCLSGFHLTCLDPPLGEVPEDDWVCSFCEAGVKPPVQLQNPRKKFRSAREMLLAAELWAARIEKIWSEQDGTYWFKARWFLIPEETSTERPKHTRSRELFLSSQCDINEMDSILRHCYVMSPDEFKKSAHDGDDVFYCEYEYNERWCRFKRIDYDHHALMNEGSGDEAYNPSDESEEEFYGEEEGRRQPKLGKKLKQVKSSKAANKRQSFAGGIEKVGAKTLVDRLKKGPQTDFEKAKAALTLSAVPPYMPCRDLERTEISAFLKDSIGAGEQCLGHCLYISGVPGTGKTATVREVIKELESKVDAGELPAFRFVEINGLRLPSPDHVYTVLHEAFTGQHLGWKKALECLDERFSNSELKGSDARPCVLVIDELDVLVNRNQSVLYNIFDWPSRPHSRLVVIGIANTMDLPERMLPRIASRMGMKRISFSPYSHKQLEEIIASRLDGVRIFDKQAAEFASRKVAAVSGDIRRALELCRRAVEVAEARIAERVSASLEQIESQDKQQQSDSVPEVTQSSGQFVTMADVDAAISQLFEAPQIQMMQRSSKLAKIFLTAMVCEQRRTSVVETTFEKIAATCSELCASNGEDLPDSDTLLGIGCKLGSLRLLLCEPGARHKLQKLQLNFPCDDVTFALKEDTGVPWLSKYL